MNKWDREVLKLKHKVSKLPPISKREEEILDKLADLLADEFFARKAAGTLPKRGKRGK